ncbi:hypothetical protein HMPREF1989_01730 [Porphyromonas gingivalis F0566]|nr:hypothetical protein HMPREF1989_01730 [Porphyromonas gingivalis F0566]
MFLNSLYWFDLRKSRGDQRLVISPQIAKKNRPIPIYRGIPIEKKQPD